jgi:hypothetical protein
LKQVPCPDEGDGAERVPGPPRLLGGLDEERTQFLQTLRLDSRSVTDAELELMLQPMHPDGIRWWTESEQDDPDPEFHTHTRLYADRRQWSVNAA